MNDELQKLHDESAIREVLTRYCRAIDRCDLELLKSVYWPDAGDDHIVFSGNAIAFADFVIPMLKEHTEATQHLIANCWLQIDGDVACGETYVQAYHRLRSDGSAVVVGGRYLDRLERRHGEWRIADRKVIIDWEQNGAPLLGGEEATRKLLSADTRSKNDVSYRLFATGRLNGGTA